MERQRLNLAPLPRHRTLRPMVTSNPTTNPDINISPRKKIFSTLWFIFCAIGLFVHGYFTTESYLKYEISSQVNIYFAEEIRPPAATLCFNMMYIVNVSALSSESGHVKCNLTDDNCKETVFNWITKLKSKNLMDTVTYNLTLFNRPYYTGPLTVSQYYRKGRKCYKYSR